MPTFCRHGRFEASCGICRREKANAAPSAAKPAGKGTTARRPAGTAGKLSAPATGRSRSRTVVTGKLARNIDDGYRSELLPGLRSSADALRLAQELTIAEARLSAIGGPAAGPWALVGELAGQPASAFVAALVIAVASPDEAAGSLDTASKALITLLEYDSSLADLERIGRVTELAAVLDAGPRGPRGHDASGAALAVPAQVAQRSGGSLEAALLGDQHWTPERRFARTLDRLAFRGLPRAVRYDVLVALGRAGALPVKADGLHLGSDQVTDAAKRLFAIADVSLLEKRAAAVVEATGVAWDAFEHALWNFAGADATAAGAAARWATAKPGTTLGLPGEADDETALTIAAILQD